MNGTKIPTGTAWTVWGVLVLVYAGFQLLQLPFVLRDPSGAGPFLAVFAFGMVAFGVWLLIVGARKRRAHARISAGVRE